MPWLLIAAASVAGGPLVYVVARALIRRSCDPTSLRAVCAVRRACDGCVALRFLDGRATAAEIGALTGAPAGDLDAALRALFPGLDAATLVDAPRPATVTYPCDPPIELALPIDWSRVPCGGSHAYKRMQNLGWIEPGDRGGAVIADWVARAFDADAPQLSVTWNDHSMAERLRTTMRFVRDYVRPGARVDRGVLHAAARLILTHLYMLVSERCYSERHNHGLIADLVILEAASWLTTLRDGPRFVAIAEARLVERQIALSVTADGMHIENSPHYHVLMIEVLANLLDAYADLGRAPPTTIAATRDALLDSLAHLLQPDGTLPQLGDTPNHHQGKKLRRLLARTSAVAPVAPRIRDELERVLAGGAPSTLDRVWPLGGYAAFREHTRGGVDTIAAHFVCKRIAGVHFHHDETSFEIYGYGQGLVIDSGRNSEERAGASSYTYSAAAHNVLIVDDHVWDAQRGRSEIIEHELGAELSWVRGSHPNHRGLGVARQVRTFAYARPDAFIVVDALRARRAHRYEQHFHLHPTLTEIAFPRRGVAVASRPGGPSVALIALDAPDAIDARPATYYPFDNTPVPTSELVFCSRRPGGIVRLAVVVLVFAPGAPVEVPEVHGTIEDDRLVVSWLRDGRPRRAAVPVGLP